ncbi:pyruvate kinase [Synechocystis sp. PCC 6803]|jgi:pyruvate kinase|nr:MULTISPECIES: pyruvate kinase [unclassified Synechocystis]ALJ69553.1 pyruvate kinase [Synechocystis sp. PCC 6803]
MRPLSHRTKIVATIGPASSSVEVIRQMVDAGMNVARLNFSHGSYEDHATMVRLLRSVEQEMDTPITLLQDLQGPKIRIGQLPGGEKQLREGEKVSLVPVEIGDRHPGAVGIDYPHLATEAKVGERILLDDGLLEMKVVSIQDPEVICEVVTGGILKSRKGVNLPGLVLTLPSMTTKDKQDLEFGLSQGIDWVSLSFVRKGEDIHTLKQFLAERGHPDLPVIAKIEKPQAIDNLEEIVAVSNGIMVARGDLGVEVNPEKVPRLQKEIIRRCNVRAIPVITATQMLDSMIQNSRPTRAEASDVANAILDGTDAVMLSGESAVGQYPVKSVQMLRKIAEETEVGLHLVNNPPIENTETHALSEALVVIDGILDLKYIVTFTTSGFTSLLASNQRPSVPVIAFTPSEKVYHSLNLVWGIIPFLINEEFDTFEDLIQQAEVLLRDRKMVEKGDQLLIMAGIPTKIPRGTNFLKIHRIS